MNISEIVTSWQKDEPIYKELGLIVSDFIQRDIPSKGIFPQVSYRTKELHSIIKKLKKKNREKSYLYSDLKDKLGLRVICDFQEDLVRVDEFLREKFSVENIEYKQDKIHFNTLDYVSNHYDVKLNRLIDYGVDIAKYQELILEIQVRTLNQHAWANSAHLLSYKLEEDLPPKLARRIYRLLSLYEIADDELSGVNEGIIKMTDSSVIGVLKKLESWFYLFARVEYDREQAIDDIRILLSFLTEVERESVQNKIEEFLNEKRSKILKIYEENRSRFFEVDFLTQPEVLLTWFILEKYEFSLSDNWGNHFDIEELNTIQGFWGVDLMS